MRTCSRCGKVKDLNEFHTNVRNKDKKSDLCKECTRCIKYTRKFGITLEQYNEMYSMQKGMCKICGCTTDDVRNSKYKNFAVDHCHTTGYVRGLLCMQCNTALFSIESIKNFGTVCEKYLNDTEYWVSPYFKVKSSVSRKRRNNTSGYIGVTYVPKNGKWVSKINHNGKSKHIGYYTTKEDAARAYNDYATKFNLTKELNII